MEPPAWAGCSALMARASIKGTQTRTAAQLALASEALGASIHPRVGADLIDWSITVPSPSFATALELLQDPAHNANFPEAEIEKEKKIALADLQQLRDDMFRYPLRLFLSAAFPDHPYGFPIELTERAIRDLSAEDLRNWHQKITHDCPTTAFVVGDVDSDVAAAGVAAFLTSNTGRTPTRERPVWPAERTEVSVERQKAQSALVLGFPGVDHKHPDAVVLHVLANTIAGLGGRLFEELRSRRALAYTVTAYPIARAQGGAFVGYIAFSPDREGEARQSLLAELGRLREDLLPAADVERAQRYTIGAWQIRSQTNGAQLGELIGALLIGRGLQELRDFEEEVNAVTPERIRDAAQKYFDERRLVEAIVRGTGAAR
jgi:zinc protease